MAIYNRPWARYEGGGENARPATIHYPENFYPLGYATNITTHGRGRTFECGDFGELFSEEERAELRETMKNGLVVSWQGVPGFVACNCWDKYDGQFALTLDGVVSLPMMLMGQSASAVRRGCYVWFNRDEWTFYITDEQENVNLPAPTDEGTWYWDLVGVLFSDGEYDTETGYTTANILLGFNPGWDMWFDIVENEG